MGAAANNVGNALPMAPGGGGSPRRAADVVRTRHWIQWSVLATYLLIPFTGLFRVDAPTGRFLIGGTQIWWDDFYIVFPFWAMVFLSATALYSNFGMVFCGWVCPQHTLSEWLNGLVRSWLGRRVLAGISPERAPGNSKRKRLSLVAAWVAFVVLVLALSVVLTLGTLHYFFTTVALWDHFTGGTFNLYIAVFAILLGTFVVIDLGLLRHFWCKYMCPYGVWQYMFRNRDTLQIRFNHERQDDCNKCSLCKDVCPVDLDPRQPEIYTRCINCAVCVDACESYMGRFDKGPILSFGFGTRAQEQERIATRRSRVWVPAVVWPLSGVAISLGLFIYGVSTFVPIKAVVHQVGDTSLYVGADHVDYRVRVVNKGSETARFQLRLTGFPDHQASFETAGESRMETTLELASGASGEVPFRVVASGLARDRPYPFQVHVVRTPGGAKRVADQVYYLPARVSDLDDVVPTPVTSVTPPAAPSGPPVDMHPSVG